MSEEQRRKLQAQLWKIADELRGKMDADEFRDYMLGFIFYRYLSERLAIYADKLLKQDGIKFDQVDESTSNGKDILEAIREEAVKSLGYFLKPSELFHKIVEKGNSELEEGTSNFILDDLTEILNHIEQSTMGTDSEEEFGGLFEDLDLTSSKLGRTEKDKNSLIVKVMSHLNDIDFQISNTEADVLGDAYEYLIGQFASGAGKKAGEFYTPQQVSTILAKIVTTDKRKLKSVYDPTCGSGSLLLRVAKEVETVGKFYGQEMNRTTYNLARMNMILHGVNYRQFDIKQEDTLEHPQHDDLVAEAVVANPPFSAKWSASTVFMNDDRFSQFGRLAPAGKADFAFVLHMIHHLDNHGRMAVVLPHGVLFRGAAEGLIRQHLIEKKNYLDAVIGLPANIFYGTSIPTCVLVIQKQRANIDNILFIDASRHFDKSTNQNHLRNEDVEKIIQTYRERTTEEKYSYVASLNEIRENEHNLNIPRYVDTFEEDEPIDLSAVSQEIIKLEKEMKGSDGDIMKFCKELGIESPF